MHIRISQPVRPIEPLPAIHPSRPFRRRWHIAWLLGLGVLVNYFDRVNLSVSQAALNTSFGISTITFGYLSGTYNWTYALFQLPIGVLLDRFGIRRIGRVSTFIWSIASFAADPFVSEIGRDSRAFSSQVLTKIPGAPSLARPLREGWETTTLSRPSTPGSKLL